MSYSDCYCEQWFLPGLARAQQNSAKQQREGFLPDVSKYTAQEGTPAGYLQKMYHHILTVKKWPGRLLVA